MNHIYKTIWNATLGAWTVTQETAKARGKSSGGSGSGARVRFAYTAVASALLLASGQVMAVTGTEYQVFSDNICFYDTTTQSVICGDATTSVVDTVDGKTAKSVAVGLKAKTAGESNVALGANSSASHTSGLAIGANAKAHHNQTVAVGERASATGEADVAIGKAAAENAVSTGRNVAIGENALSSATRANNVIAIGTNASSGSDSTHTVAIGTNASSGSDSTHTVAIGTNANSTEGGKLAIKSSNNVAVGYNSRAGNNNATDGGAVAIGYTTTASMLQSTALGSAANAGGQYSLAAGANASVTENSNYAIAIGGGNTSATAATASNAFATAVGYNAKSVGRHATALGSTTSAAGLGSAALGSGATTTNTGAISISATTDNGATQRTTASGSSSIAMGVSTTAQGANSIAVGNSSNAYDLSTVSVGNQSGSAGVDYAGRASALRDPRTQAGRTHNEGLLEMTNIGNKAGENTINNQQGVNIGSEAGTGGYNSAWGGGVSVGHQSGAVDRTTSAAVATEMLNFSATSRGAQSGVIVTGNNNTAVGSKSGKNALGHDNVALGADAGGYSSGNSNISIGHNAGRVTNAVGTEPDHTQFGSAHRTISVGEGAYASKDDAIAIGSRNLASGTSAIAIGTRNQVSGDYSGALGDPSYITGSGTYTIGNDNGTAAAPIAANNAGAFGNNNLMGAGAASSRIVGNNNNVQQTNTFVMGNAVTTTQANSVVLGNASADRAATTEATGTVDGVTYGTFAGQGSAAKGVVSVGSAGNERQIINVAAGNISATSTDAINGSQLFHVTRGLQNQISNTATHYYSVNDTGATRTNTDPTNKTNTGATGIDALAAGVNAAAAGNDATAVGRGADAAGNDSVAIGHNAKTDAINTVAIGYNTQATGVAGVAMGWESIASGNHSMALGGSSQGPLGSIKTTAAGDSSMAIGFGAQTGAGSSWSMAMGDLASVGTNAGHAIAFGAGSSVADNATNAVAYGSNASASAANAIAMGSSASSTADKALAFGTFAQATHAGSVAIGSYSETDAPHIGNYTLNGSYAAAATAPTMVVSVGKAGEERQIQNVAAGVVSATSTDAINGSQLYATNDYLGNLASTTASVLGGNAAVNGTGNITMTDVGGTGQNTVDDAIRSINTTANAGWNLQANSGPATKIAPNGVVNVVDGSNTTVSLTGNQLQVNVVDNPTFTSVTTGGNVLDGTALTVNNNTVTNVNDAINQTAVQAFNPLTFAGDTGTNVTRRLGDTLNIKGNATGATVDGNIAVEADGTDTLTVKLAENINLGAAGSLTTGGTVVDNSGLTIVGGPSVTTTGINAGGQQITNVAAGTADDHAVNYGQLRAVTGNVTNVSNVIGGNTYIDSDGRLTPAGEQALKTYDVSGQTATKNDNVIDAIKNMNEGGIKYFHTNDASGQTTGGTLATGTHDSSASGSYSTAVGFEASATAQSALAIGHGAQANGINSISIGTGNVVNATGAGAIGDPSIVDGTNSYSVGNNNAISSTASNSFVLGGKNSLGGTAVRDVNGVIDSTQPITVVGSAQNSVVLGNQNTVQVDNTMVMGNNVTANVANSVYLGANAAATASATAQSAGTTAYNSATINGTAYNYAGGTPAGVVTVGGVGGERRIQNVAAGLISATSTDAINGSQLYAAHQAIEALSVTSGAGWNLQANGNTTTITPINPTLNVVDGSNTTVSLAGNQLQVNVVNNPTFSGPVTANGGLSVGNNLTVQPGTTVDMGGNRITNVADGQAPTDAVTVQQLQNAQMGNAGQVGVLADRIHQVSRNADAGTASAMAMAGLPQAYLPGKSMIAAGASAYRGASAIAMGLSTISDNGKWILKGTISGNNRGHVGAAIGAGFQW